MKSCRKEGEYFVFTCGCGIPGCAGISQGIDVKYVDSFIIWKVPNPLDQSQQAGTREKDAQDKFIFSKSEYIEALRKGLSEIKQSLREDEDLDIDPAITYRGDVLNLGL